MSSAYVTNGIGLVSERNGVPVRASRRVAGSNASRTASPQDSASPPWWISSRITSVRAVSVRCRCSAGARPPARRSPRRRRSRRRGALAVAERRVQADADPVRGVRPLVLEVLGRRDHRDRAGSRGAPAARRRPAARTWSCRRRASRPRGSRGLRRRGQVGVERLLLPGAERRRRPRGRGREGRGKVGGGSGTHRWDEANGVPRATCRPLQVSREPGRTCYRVPAGTRSGTAIRPASATPTAATDAITR